MSFFISNFENYIDTWISTNTPKDYTIHNFFFKENNKILNKSFAEIYNDNHYDWMVEQSDIWKWNVHPSFHYIEMDCVACWKINTEHPKHLGEYFIHSNSSDFNKNYYHLKELLYKMNISKNDWIHRLGIHNNKVCVRVDDLNNDDLIQIKLSLSQGIFH
jgi:hypothetical protein